MSLNVFLRSVCVLSLFCLSRCSLIKRILLFLLIFFYRIWLESCKSQTFSMKSHWRIYASMNSAVANLWIMSKHACCSYFAVISLRLHAWALAQAAITEMTLFRRYVYTFWQHPPPPHHHHHWPFIGRLLLVKLRTQAPDNVKFKSSK